MLSSTPLTTLNGKVAVITGGSRGIGKAVANALVANGAKVVIGDVLDKEGQATVDFMNENAGTKVAAFIHSDVAEYSNNIALFKLAETEFGGVDYAFLNAGVACNCDSMFSPLEDKTEERIIDVNTTAVIKGTKVALLHMAKRGGGSIVLTASTNGFYNYPFLASYCASKHAVIGYTRSFELMPQICNVRVNAICPFWIDTDLVTPFCALNENEYPESELVRNQPRTSMDTVIKGVLTLITDESRNTQTIMALPDGLQVVDPLPIPASFRSEASDKAAKKYIPAAVVAGQRRLAKALARYEKDQTLE